MFRKDYDAHKENPLELLDQNKSYVVGAGINTKDYEERVPALVEAGLISWLLIHQMATANGNRETIQYVKRTIMCRSGQVISLIVKVSYLVESGADFVKVGIGGGSICITREQKGIGRGQASSSSKWRRLEMNITKRQESMSYLFGWRYCSRLPYYAGVGDGRGLRHDGPIFCPL